MSSSHTEMPAAATATLVDVTMPQMGVSVAEGTIVSWAKQIGDRVQADETICEISTDKIDTEIPAPVTGIVAEILVEVDTTVEVGVVLARIAAPEPPMHIESPYRPDPVPVTGTGQLSRMRRQIGAHMKRSLETAAHCTTWIEVDMTRVQTARSRLGVTALSFVAGAVIAALREHPQLNATLEGERYTQHADINLGIAVSLGDDGLIVPVIHRAHELSVEGLAARIRDLATRARARELKPDEVRGGTFTITNPGQYGSIMATPIINQPQVAILDLEAIVKRPVVVTDADGNDSIAIRAMTILGLSWDHRALDGALSAQFLASVKRGLENA